MGYRVYPYKQGSRSARSLAEALGGRVLKLEESRWKAKVGDTVINWGSSSMPRVPFSKAIILNEPQRIAFASNKLNFFNEIKRYNENDDDGRANPISIPTFWTDRAAIPADAYPIVCRTILTGHSGQGIVIAETPEELVNAPLYTKYIKKKHEYRIHVGKSLGGETSVISVQRKAKREGLENVDFKIRNLANGFVFVRDGVVPPQAVLDMSIKAIEVLDLDFGAVDIIWNQRFALPYVLEVNCAPGLEGQTINDYANWFRQGYVN